MHSNVFQEKNTKKQKSSFFQTHYKPSHIYFNRLSNDKNLQLKQTFPAHVNFLLEATMIHALPLETTFDIINKFTALPRVSGALRYASTSCFVYWYKKAYPCIVYMQVIESRVVCVYLCVKNQVKKISFCAQKGSNFNQISILI